MLDFEILSNLFLNGGELKKVSFEKRTSDPTGSDLYAGRFWALQTGAKYIIKFYDGEAVKVFGEAGTGIQTISSPNGSSIVVDSGDPANIVVSLNESVTSVSDSLVRRDADGKIKADFNPTANDDAVNKSYVDGLAASSGRPTIGYDPGFASEGDNADFPSDYSGDNIQLGDRFIVSGNLSGTLGGASPLEVQPGDELIAKVADAGNDGDDWYAIQGNLRKAGQNDWDADDDTKYVTPKLVKDNLTAGDTSRRFSTTITGDGTYRDFTIALPDGFNGKEVEGVFIKKDDGSYVGMPVQHNTNENQLLLSGNPDNGLQLTVRVIAAP